MKPEGKGCHVKRVKRLKKSRKDRNVLRCFNKSMSLKKLQRTMLACQLNHVFFNAFFTHIISILALSGDWSTPLHGHQSGKYWRHNSDSTTNLEKGLSLAERRLEKQIKTQFILFRFHICCISIALDCNQDGLLRIHSSPQPVGNILSACWNHFTRNVSLCGGLRNE